ncbi:MAG: hypothetical protein DRO90_01465 [Candidatus Altiarchaeales archaeon]|nr:MAG: hypothetical protein DRO94_03905 [Candidatus Altiarchaeales archaeon]RLI94797.1 MAG: hypothetical protein DRO90_01465 [Candidatus Altiarchaeales archaeon]HDO82409.1 hypothetical protein [Candidatus Altiarchaeales archaeon]HEX55058.1 hypothetical protein [Candidatus Altiarchaeales archaeon]
MKLEPRILEKRKDYVELKFSERTVPSVILEKLLENGVDAYIYEPHPLFNEIRLHIDSKNALEELKKAVNEVEEEWNELRDLFMKELKKVKCE